MSGAAAAAVVILGMQTPNSPKGRGPEREWNPHDTPPPKPWHQRVITTIPKLFGLVSTDRYAPTRMEAKTYKGVTKEKGKRRNKAQITIERNQEKDDILLINGVKIDDLDQIKVLIGRNAISRHLIRRRLRWDIMTHDE